MQETISGPCACGCGKTLERRDARGRPRRFLPGHWSRLQPHQREARTCENCGAAVTRPQWHLRKVAHHFCGSPCAGEWAQREGVRRGTNNGHYNTITVPCSGCAAPVSKAESLIARRNGRVYCPNCVHLVRRGRKGFYVGYPPEFSQALRRRIRKRDAYCCQVCGVHQKQAGTLHVHHIDYDKQHNDERNLIALCRTCHGETNFSPEQWQRRLSQLVAQRFP